MTNSLALLSLLASAPNKSALATLLNRVYLQTPLLSPSPFPPPTVSTVMDAFSLTADQSEDLYAALLSFLKQTLHQHTPSGNTAGFVTTLLSGEVDERVVTLLSTIVPTLCDNWRKASLASKPSPPKLSSVDWQVSMPLGNDSASVTMQLGVESAAAEDKVVFEMSTQGVDTFIAGLSKIKAQLSKVAM
ncbi:hypothetical protein TeGR_g653 [Tetraparma gracilis]|uniref:COMM domain-containing protein n=1 Tax=Tetraparma gracilis TaxID=2962635 RepID=A0ABQ6N4M9_9STRA|nr:hypothetical protein TeGR_g653 [Tetraparma gracilis]